MTEWPPFVRHAFHARHVLDLDTDLQEIPPFRERWGSLDLSAFVRALREGDPYDQQIAAFALGQFPSRFCRDELLPFLNHPDPAVRWTVAEQLGEMREEAAFPTLLSMLQEFLPPHESCTYDWFDIHHLEVPHLVAAYGRTEAMPVLRETLSQLWQAEHHRDASQNPQLWWDYEDALVAALGSLGDWEALAGLGPVPRDRAVLWAVTLVCGYLGLLHTATVVQYRLLDLLNGEVADEPTGRLALAPDLLISRLGYAPEDAAAFSWAYIQAALARLEQDSPPSGG